MTEPQSTWYAIPIFPAILTAGLALAGGWIGGLLGVRRDAEKLAKQRAFDQRLEWYLRLSRTMARIAFQLRKFTGELPLSKEHLEAVYESLFALESELREGQFFATRGTADALAALMSAMDNEYDRHPKLENELISKSSIAALMTEFQRAHRAMTADVREHLGLEPLANHPLDVEF